MSYFTDIFNLMTAEEKDEILKTVIMNTDSEKASEVRLDYYKSILKHVGENVKIGANVKFMNPQLISIGDNVTIGNDCTINAREGTHVTIDNGVILCERV